MSYWVWAMILGFILDLAIGDPHFSLHPVRLIGNLAGLGEFFFRPRFPPFMAGILTWLMVLGSCYVVGLILLTSGKVLLGFPGQLIAGSFIIWASIALRDLAAHALRVREALKRGDLVQARQRVAMIVGRETESLDAQGVAKAAVESVAESFVDGIAAPLFWAALLGPLGALVYRGINTMDSMFGHKNEQYLSFGRFPAKADDAATYLPARIAPLFICLAAPLVGASAKRAFQVFRRDRLKHESPNSAHGEAAFAGALGIVLGGPTRYTEGTVQKPYIGKAPMAEPCDGETILKAVRLMVLGSLFWVILMLAISRGLRFLTATLWG